MPLYSPSSGNDPDTCLSDERCEAKVQPKCILPMQQQRLQAEDQGEFGILCSRLASAESFSTRVWISYEVRTCACEQLCHQVLLI